MTLNTSHKKPDTNSSEYWSNNIINMVSSPSGLNTNILGYQYETNMHHKSHRRKILLGQLALYHS